MTNIDHIYLKIKRINCLSKKDVASIVKIGHLVYLKKTKIIGLSYRYVTIKINNIGHIFKHFVVCPTSTYVVIKLTNCQYVAIVTD